MRVGVDADSELMLWELYGELSSELKVVEDHGEDSPLE